MRITLRQLASPLAIVAFMSVVYYVWFAYDWNYPDLKVFGFLAALGLVYYTAREGSGPRLPPRMLGVEMALVGVVFAVNAFLLVRTYGHRVFDIPRIDIATTTVKSARMLLHNHQNPYASDKIDLLPNLPPEFRGFHYGPIMMLGYAGALFWPHGGYKFTSVFCILVTAVAVCLLVRRKTSSTRENVAACVFAVTMLLLPRRFWHDTLALGANDMFPIALAMVSLYFVRTKQLLLAGLFAGLSFSTKFSPAAFLILLFLRKDWKPLRPLAVGVALGLLPVLAFLVWDWAAFVNSVFKMRFLVQYDSTSLYWITPPRFHFVFPLVLYSTVGWVLFRNFKKPLDDGELLVDFTLLLTVAEVTFKQIHTNHFIWFYPLFAVVLTANRHGLFLTPELRVAPPPPLDVPAPAPPAPGAPPSPDAGGAVEATSEASVTGTSPTLLDEADGDLHARG